MLTRKKDIDRDTVLDKRRLQAIGVLLPIKLAELSFLPGRHPLGRAGEGMRFLRSRPFEPGEDNPRDIDKFSTHGNYWVNESESEVQASIYLVCDNSASMAFPQKASVRNLALLQLTYSLWRACDRVHTILYSKDSIEEFSERNLKSQMEKLGKRLSKNDLRPGIDVPAVLDVAGLGTRGRKNDIIFLISDFSPSSSEYLEFSTHEWRSVLRKIAGDIVPVITSFVLPYEATGMMKLWDPERGVQRLTYMSRSRIDKINMKEKERVNGLIGFFRKIGLDHLLIRQERDVYPQLARLTGLRRRRKT